MILYKIKLIFYLMFLLTLGLSGLSFGEDQKEVTLFSVELFPEGKVLFPPTTPPLTDGLMLPLLQVDPPETKIDTVVDRIKQYDATLEDTMEVLSAEKSASCDYFFPLPVITDTGPQIRQLPFYSPESLIQGYQASLLNVFKSLISEDIVAVSDTLFSWGKNFESQLITHQYNSREDISTWLSQQKDKDIVIIDQGLSFITVKKQEGDKIIQFILNFDESGNLSSYSKSYYTVVETNSGSSERLDFTKGISFDNKMNEISYGVYWGNNLPLGSYKIIAQEAGGNVSFSIKKGNEGKIPLGRIVVKEVQKNGIINAVFYINPQVYRESAKFEDLSSGNLVLLDSGKYISILARISGDYTKTLLRSMQVDSLYYDKYYVNGAKYFKNYEENSDKSICGVTIKNTDTNSHIQYFFKVLSNWLEKDIGIFPNNGSFDRIRVEGIPILSDKKGVYINFVSIIGAITTAAKNNQLIIYQLSKEDGGELVIATKDAFMAEHPDILTFGLED